MIIFGVQMRVRFFFKPSLGASWIENFSCCSVRDTHKLDLTPRLPTTTKLGGATGGDITETRTDRNKRPRRAGGAAVPPSTSGRAIPSTRHPLSIPFETLPLAQLKVVGPGEWPVTSSKLGRAYILFDPEFSNKTDTKYSDVLPGTVSV